MRAQQRATTTTEADASTQQGAFGERHAMFYGYCFLTIDGQYTPKVHLETPEQCFRYCQRWAAFFPEIRITDADDCCVLHVRNNVLKVPYPNNEFRWFHLQEPREVTKEEQW
jgi:hypothetical protein